MKLAINEIFGPTFQGEGPSTGRRAMFLRLAGCNLKCGINGGWKCDTPYTWDWRGEIGPAYDRKDEVELVSTLEHEALWQRIDRGDGTRLLVITGGEPLLQSNALSPLVSLAVFEKGWSVEFETNGTVPEQFGITPNLSYNISPKLESSGNPLEKRLNVPALRSFLRPGIDARFKFVIADEQDIDEVQEIARIVGIPGRQVWLMPEGVTAERQLDNGMMVSKAALALGYNFSTRLHILLWKNARGK